MDATNHQEWELCWQGALNRCAHTSQFPDAPPGQGLPVGPWCRDPGKGTDAGGSILAFVEKSTERLVGMVGRTGAGAEKLPDPKPRIPTPPLCPHPRALRAADSQFFSGSQRPTSYTREIPQHGKCHQPRWELFVKRNKSGRGRGFGPISGQRLREASSPQTGWREGGEQRQKDLTWAVETPSGQEVGRTKSPKHRGGQRWWPGRFLRRLGLVMGPSCEEEA